MKQKEVSELSSTKLSSNSIDRVVPSWQKMLEPDLKRSMIGETD